MGGGVYDGQYNVQYSGQYKVQYSGQYSVQYSVMYSVKYSLPSTVQSTAPDSLLTLALSSKYHKKRQFYILCLMIKQLFHPVPRHFGFRNTLLSVPCLSAALLRFEIWVELVKSPWSCQGPENSTGLSGVWCLVSHVWFLVSSVCCLQESGVWWSFSGAARRGVYFFLKTHLCRGS